MHLNDYTYVYILFLWKSLTDTPAIMAKDGRRCFINEFLLNVRIRVRNKRIIKANIWREKRCRWPGSWDGAGTFEGMLSFRTWLLMRPKDTRGTGQKAKRADGRRSSSFLRQTGASEHKAEFRVLRESSFFGCIKLSASLSPAPPNPKTLRCSSETRNRGDWDLTGVRTESQAGGRPGSRGLHDPRVLSVLSAFTNFA